MDALFRAISRVPTLHHVYHIVSPLGIRYLERVTRYASTVPRSSEKRDVQTAEGRESKPGVRKVQMRMMRGEWMEERDRNKRLGISPQIAAAFSHQRFFRRAREKLPLSS